MKKKIITTLTLFLFWGALTSLIHAQEYNNFDLSKYYTPDILRNQLDLNFGGQNNGSISTQNTLTTIGNQFYGNLSSDFLNYQNNRHTVSLFYLSADLNGTSNNSKNLNNITYSRNFLSNDKIQLNYNVKYYNPNQLYMTVGLDGFAGVNISRSRSVQYSAMNTLESNNTYNNYFTATLNPKLGVGFGRLESVEDARQAIYILDELTKKGALTHGLTNDEIFQFSQQISRIKNKRFFDSRLRKIEEITYIDSLLNSQKLITNSNITYYTTLNDMWEYGALFSRKSGQSFEMSMTPTIEFNRDIDQPNDISNWQDRKKFGYGGSINLNYNYEKPVRLDWQHSVSAGFSYHENFNNLESLVTNNSSTTTINSTENGASLYARYSISYYQNTRTYYTASITSNSNVYHFSSDSTTPYQSSSSSSYFLNLSNYFGLSANYYLSPQIRLAGSLSIGDNYQSQSGNVFNYKNQRISATITYSLF